MSTDDDPKDDASENEKDDAFENNESSIDD